MNQLKTGGTLWEWEYWWIVALFEIDEAVYLVERLVILNDAETEGWNGFFTAWDPIQHPFSMLNNVYQYNVQYPWVFVLGSVYGLWFQEMILRYNLPNKLDVWWV